MDLLAGLNAEQSDAVRHVEGPLLVLAGAGSGKTRVITHRVAYLIERGVSPSQLLAITFTNKAAGEMQQRIQRLVPGGAVWVSTFHKLCARLLRMYGRFIGIEPGYVIYDRADRLRVIRDCLGRLGLDPAHLPPDRIEHAISRAKNDLVDAEAYRRKAHDFFRTNTAAVYRLYEEQLRAANALDFDDLLLRTAMMLREEPGLRADLDERFRFVLVDEYQDTNLAQYAIVRGLSIDHPNLCVTGDPDQSIYGWRGANLGNILQFESDFPGARVVRLEKNYRSTKRILLAASHLIRFNKRRKPKDLITDNPEGLPVAIRAYVDERDESLSIARQIGEAVAAGRRRHGDFAILLRVAALTRALEMGLAAEQVPYQVLSGVAFFERAEVKDLLAYLKLLVNPRDDVAFERVVNVPARGIGKSTIERLRGEADRTRRPLLETSRAAGQLADIKPRQAQALAAFVELIDELRALSGGSIAELFRQVLGRTRYLVEAGATSESDERRANVEELITAAHQFDLTCPGGDLEQFLTESVLTTDLDEWDPSLQRVSIMTLHAAKGLEFPVIFITAVEQGILPHQRSLEEGEGHVEEERRLLFVGMTRAKEELSLSFVHERDFRGQRRRAIPSSFLTELPRQPAKPPEPTRKLLMTGAELAGAPRPMAATSSEFAEGMLVCHPTYGLGRVASLSGYGDQCKATVNFTVGGTRIFVVSRSPLRPVRSK